MQSTRRTMMRLFLVAVALLSPVIGVEAQEEVRAPRRGGGNAENNTPDVYKSWAEAQSACDGAQNKWRVAKQAYNNAKRKYDDIEDSGGGSTDKAGKIAEAGREKDDKYRTEVSFRNAYKRAAAGCVNFAADETKNATTDAAKQAAKIHRETAARWDGEAKGG